MGHDTARAGWLHDEAIGYAHTIKIRALARLGELLNETEKASGGRPQKNQYPKRTGYCWAADAGRSGRVEESLVSRAAACGVASLGAPLRK
jgi:hypothetical protein